MTIKFERIQSGATLYDRHSQRMGNTTLKSIGEWRVKIISLNSVTETAVVSWNGNREETWDRRQLEKLSTWSMGDPDAVVERGAWDRVISVKRKKGIKR